MNERMEKILTRKAQDHDVLQVTINPIIKPDVLSCTNPSIYIDDSYFFYTFDGRSLFFSRDQTDPIISVPEETKDVCMTRLNGVEYCFTLSLKNKLECLVGGPGTPDKKYCVTRNVLQVQKTNDKIYFIFKKDHLYFINECHFDGKKWIGKIIHTNIEGKSVELFATDGTFFFTNDGKLYNSRGDAMGVDADFVHKAGNLMVVGHKEEHGYMFRMLDCANMSEIDSLLIPTMARGTIKGHQNIIVQQIHSELYVLKATDEGFAVGGHIKYTQDVLCFGIESHDDQVFITPLVLEGCDRQTFTIQGRQIPAVDLESGSCFSSEDVHDESDASGLNPEGQSEWMSSFCAIKPGSSPEEGDVEGDFFYDRDGSKRPSILKEMESISLVDGASRHSVSKPKNKLLEEVRATLNRRSQSENEQQCVPHTEGPETDRFANYAREEGVEDKGNEQKLISGTLASGASCDARTEVAAPPEPETICAGLHGSQAEKSPENSSSSCNNIAGHTLLAREDRSIYAEDESSAGKQPSASKTETRKRSRHNLGTENHSRDLALEHFLFEHKRVSLETQKATVAAVQSMLTKTGGVETMIREVIIKTLVPSVEACFNEMRIQILAEVKKLVSSALDSSNPRVNTIQKLINAGRISQAIQEFLRLDESDMNISLDLFSCSNIENADSNILAQFLSKIFSLAKKHPKDVHFRLITACLLDIEVNDLTIENMQNLSVLLRYLKELDEFDDNKHNELNCLADIIIKKIKRRTKQGSANKGVQ